MQNILSGFRQAILPPAQAVFSDFALILACVLRFTGMIYFIVKQKSFEVILLHYLFSTPNINIASLYMAILLADVLTASDMRMREKLRHKGNYKNLLLKYVHKKRISTGAAKG